MDQSTKPIASLGHPAYAEPLEAATLLEPTQVARLELIEFLIDSVVATVTMIPSSTNREATIDWGDGATDVVDLRKPPATSPLAPPGAYRVQHAYTLGAALGKVLVSVAVASVDGSTSFEAETLRIDPRFTVSVDPVVVRATDHDSIFEDRQEFAIWVRVYQWRDEEREVIYEHEWKWTPGRAPGVGELPPVGRRVVIGVLPQSDFTLEMTLHDEAIAIYTNYADRDSTFGKVWDGVTEWLKDPGFPEFDGSVNFSTFLHPKDLSPTFTVFRNYDTRDGYFSFEFSGTLRLIVPLDAPPVSALA
ncbi:hypothetical protein [Demequina sp. NBRC 110054]|uniref:hypothetical protein n=1 Tax=Demequina sp. NBRC 110054 TaxID=1570343 RepID=UPI0011776986|nr:hypothetical protein [Demequina sp. NBRC 110054]